jgi:hypothetical protein
MLHIHNGDSSADTAKKTSIPGEHIPWREALVCGPVPGGLSEQHFLDIRTRHLADAYHVPLEKCAADLRAQHDALATFADHDEVVLWFEHDLFCQVHLIYLLHWFAGRELGQTKLSLICVGEFPGLQPFHGLGELNEEQLTSLFPDRQEVTAAQLDLGRRAWEAYSAPDAVQLIQMLESDTSALPYLQAALRWHVQRFPSIRNGLGRVENASLALIAQGRNKFGSLFPAFVRREPGYGFGDTQLYLALQRMAHAPTPMLKQDNGHDSSVSAARVFLSSFEINDHGKAALAGDEDFVIANGIDLWLGGIHLQGKESAWRWDEEVQELLVSLDKQTN